MSKQLDRIERKVMEMDQKLDTHLERLSKAETSIEWLKGSVKIAITMMLTAFGSAVGFIVKYFGDK